jgi:transcriptional regulator with XRE-family HTH domain
MKACSKELKIFSRILRLRRYEMLLTQEGLSEKVGCHPNAIGRIERAQAFPSFKMIINLAKALKISPKDLMPS